MKIGERLIEGALELGFSPWETGNEFLTVLLLPVKCVISLPITIPMMLIGFVCLALDIGENS